MFNDETQGDTPETESIELEEVDQADDAPDVEEQSAEVEEPSTDWEAEAKKWKAIAQRNQKKTVRADSEQRQAAPALSAKDLLAISKAGIEPDDLDEVLEYAQFKKVPVHEALKAPVIQAALATSAEHRKSAQATNTAPARRGSATVSDETLLANARKGIMPDNDADMMRLVKLDRRHS